MMQPAQRGAAIIDSHVHLWSLSAAFHQWPDATLPAIHRDFGEAELAVVAERVDAAILVQAQPDMRETDWLLQVAGRHRLIAGVVGWLPHDADAALAALARTSSQPDLVGVRPMLQDLPDIGWLRLAEFAPVIATLVDRELTFDALVRTHQLPDIYELARGWPDLRIVIDHGAKPVIGHAPNGEWCAGMERLAELPNVWCKLSGLRTEQAPGSDPAALAPYMEHLLRCFPDRLMWGSDWPVLLLSGEEHAGWLRFAEDLVRRVSPQQVDSVFGGAAAGFYGRPVRSVAAPQRR